MCEPRGGPWAAGLNMSHVGSSDLRIVSGDRTSFRVGACVAHPASGKQSREKPLSLSPVRNMASVHDTHSVAIHIVGLTPDKTWAWKLPSLSPTGPFSFFFLLFEYWT